MADYVRLTKNGLRAFRWNSEKRSAAKERGESTKDRSKFYDEWEPQEAEVWRLLRCRCEVEKGTTILDVFKMVDKYELLKEFLKSYSWCKDIDEFHKQAEETAPPDQDYDGLEYAEVYCGGEVHENDLTVWEGFHAFGSPPKDDDTVKYEQDEKIAYSISYSPAYRYAKLPLRLNEEVTLYDWRVKGQPGVLFKGSTCLSLLQVLDAIYWDISFVGGPVENKAFLDEMKETVDSIKSGDVDCGKRYISLDEMLKDLSDPDDE